MLSVAMGLLTIFVIMMWVLLIAAIIAVLLKHWQGSRNVKTLGSIIRCQECHSKHIVLWDHSYLRRDRWWVQLRCVACDEFRETIISQQVADLFDIYLDLRTRATLELFNSILERSRSISPTTPI